MQVQVCVRKGRKIVDQRVVQAGRNECITHPNQLIDEDQEISLTTRFTLVVNQPERKGGGWWSIAETEPKARSWKDWRITQYRA